MSDSKENDASWQEDGEDNGAPSEDANAEDTENGVMADTEDGSTAADPADDQMEATNGENGDEVEDLKDTFSIDVTASISSNLRQRYNDAKQMTGLGQDNYTDGDFMEELLDVYEKHIRVKAALGTEDPQTVSQRALEWLLSQISPCLCGNAREVKKFWLDDVVPIVKLNCENSHICVWHGALGEMPGFDPETSGKELTEVDTALHISDSKDTVQPIVIQPLGTPEVSTKRGRPRGRGRGKARGRGGTQAAQLAQQQMMNAMMMNPMMMMMGGLANMQNLVNLNQQAMQIMGNAGNAETETPAPSDKSSSQDVSPQPVMLIQHEKSSSVSPKPDPSVKTKEEKNSKQREFTRAGRGQNKKMDDDSWSEDGVSDGDTSNDDGDRLSGARKRKAGPVTRQVKRHVSYTEPSDAESGSESPITGSRHPEISVKMEVEEIKEAKDPEENQSDEDDDDDDDNKIEDRNAEDSDEVDEKPNINMGEALIKIVKMGDRWQRWGKADSDMPDFMRTLNVNQMAVQGTHMYETVYYSESGQLEPMFQELAPVRDFQCRLCNKTFTNKGAKGRHETVHSEKLYRCRWCGILRNKSISLLLHLRDDHKPDHDAPPEVYECAQCHENFLELGEIHSHMRERHKISASTLGEDLAVMHCYYPDCGRSFKDRSTLKFHIKRAHRENGSPICGMCGKVFPSQRDRTRHMMAVHNEDYT